MIESSTARLKLKNKIWSPVKTSRTSLQSSPSPIQAKQYSPNESYLPNRSRFWHINTLNALQILSGQAKMGGGVLTEKINSNPSLSSSSSTTCFSHFCTSALRTKALTSSTNHRDELLRRLGLFQLVLIGVGASIGAGIFVVTGTVARDAGPGIFFFLNYSNSIQHHGGREWEGLKKSNNSLFI